MGETKAICLWRLPQRGQGGRLAQAKHTGLSASSFLELRITPMGEIHNTATPGHTEPQRSWEEADDLL